MFDQTVLCGLQSTLGISEKQHICLLL